MDKIIAQSLTNFPLRHFFTTRHGGISKKPYNSNNIALHVNDNPNDVEINRANLLKEIGASKLIVMNQVHSNSVEIVDATYSKLIDCDGIMTNVKDIALMVMVADCTPVIMYESEKNIICVLHVGRAGAFSNIINKAISKMKSVFNAKEENIHVVLGVSIGVCCYEVNSAIKKEAESLGYDFSITMKEEKPFLDVNAIILNQLHCANVPDTNIEELNQCSSCNNQRFFSYRADNQQTGRMCAIISL